MYTTQLVLWITILWMSPARPQLPEDKHKMLTETEASTIRKIIYEDGLSTCILRSGPFANSRGIALPKQVVVLHKSKRVATLKLLLEIVRSAKPKDALTAAGLSIALEDNPVAGAPYADSPPHVLDRPGENNGPTMRARVIKLLEKNLLAAEKEKKAGGKPE